jgi:hypothetical protein
MRKLLLAVLLSSSFLIAQDNGRVKDSKGEVTVTGCVSRASGDYTLIKQDPAMTYELQGTHKIKLSHYVGQRVEVTGSTSPSMATSSDAMARTGSPSPVTFTVSSIKTLDKNCSARDVNR